MSDIWVGELGIRGPMSDVQGAGGLYREVRCIMSNTHMGTSLTRSGKENSAWLVTRLTKRFILSHRKKSMIICYRDQEESDALLGPIYTEHQH